jgi:hypothetical protein
MRNRRRLRELSGIKDTRYGESAPESDFDHPRYSGKNGERLIMRLAVRRNGRDRTLFGEVE